MSSPSDSDSDITEAMQEIPHSSCSSHSRRDPVSISEPRRKRFCYLSDSVTQSRRQITKYLVGPNSGRESHDSPSEQPAFSYRGYPIVSDSDIAEQDIAEIESTNIERRSSSIPIPRNDEHSSRSQHHVSPVSHFLARFNEITFPFRRGSFPIDSDKSNDSDTQVPTDVSFQITEIGDNNAEDDELPLTVRLVDADSCDNNVDNDDLPLVLRLGDVTESTRLQIESQRNTGEQRNTSQLSDSYSSTEQNNASDDVVILSMISSPNIESNSAVAQPSTNGSTGSQLPNQSDSGNRPHLDGLEFNSKLVSLLECPVCMDVVIPPIHQCKKGHPVCSVCWPRLINCPICRSRFSEDRNLLMEKVTELMLFPCKNMMMGCSEMIQLKDKFKHEVKCNFRWFSCIEKQCNWKGFKQELVVHCNNAHSQVVLQNNQKVRVHLDKGADPTWVMSAYNEVFIVKFNVIRNDLRGWVLCLSSPETAKKFSYKFSITGKKRSRLIWKEGIYSEWILQTRKLFRYGLRYSLDHVVPPNLRNENQRSHVKRYHVDVTVSIIQVK